MKLKQDNEIMWQPSLKSTKIEEFRSHVNRKYSLDLEEYQDLWKWSIDHYDAFWTECWNFFKIKHSVGFSKVVDTSKSIQEIPEWFYDAKLNYAENLLQGNDEDVALITAGERRKVEKITFKELRNKVSVLKSALESIGIKPGDRVAGYIPNCSLAVEAMLATSAIGAIWTSTSPDFGVTGVLERFSQINPKVVISVDAVIYNDKTHDHLEKLSAVVKGLPDLEKVVLLPYVRGKAEIDISGIPNCVFLDDFLRDVEDNPSLEFFQGPFCLPLFIMFSSGTTGPPKCMVHSAGGTLIQHLKEHVLHGNTTKDDIIMYYTTTGWMMWNWLVSALATSAAVVLYDGSPLVPSYNVLWDLVDGLGITILGTGAKWLQALQEREVYPIKTHKLTSLHTILSTGSPLNSASYEYVYSSIKKDVVLGSITGGTDIISCFAGQNLTVPVYKGEIQARNLGMAVESWDCEGNRVFDASGELVCLKPFPSMPVYFWNDYDGKKYRKAYFEKFKGVWSHGDFCVISSVTGGIIMLGRSDGTLNPGGVRFGSAEIYNIVESSRFPEVTDSLCVGQSTDDGERVVLFVKLTESEAELTEDLKKRIRSEIRQQLSARHVPSFILQTKDIPYTISGKKVEVAVKKILNGEHVTQRGALVNPDSLDFYYNIPQLVQT